MSQQRQDDQGNGVTVFRRACRAMKSAMRDEAGVTAIEYALLAALIAIVVVGSITSAGNSLNGLWTMVSTEVAAVVAGL